VKENVYSLKLASLQQLKEEYQKLQLHFPMMLEFEMPAVFYGNPLFICGYI
jgi:hypothetical protein